MSNTILSSISPDDFNTFFVSVASKIVEYFSVDSEIQDTLLNNIPEARSSFVFLPVTEYDLENAINYLKRLDIFEPYIRSCLL